MLDKKNTKILNIKPHQLKLYFCLRESNRNINKKNKRKDDLYIYTSKYVHKHINYISIFL